MQKHIHSFTGSSGQKNQSFTFLTVISAWILLQQKLPEICFMVAEILMKNQLFQTNFNANYT